MAIPDYTSVLYEYRLQHAFRWGEFLPDMPEQYMVYCRTSPTLQGLLLNISNITWFTAEHLQHYMVYCRTSPTLRGLLLNISNITWFTAEHLKKQPNISNIVWFQASKFIVSIICWSNISILTENNYANIIILFYKHSSAINLICTHDIISLKCTETKTTLIGSAEVNLTSIERSSVLKRYAERSLWILKLVFMCHSCEVDALLGNVAMTCIIPPDLALIMLLQGRHRQRRCLKWCSKFCSGDCLLVAGALYCNSDVLLLCCTAAVLHCYNLVLLQC